MTEQLHKFFQLCDPDGSNNSVNRNSFRQLCNRFEISDHDADGIFDDLDQDHDGQITFEDFSRGFSVFLISAGMAESESEQSLGHVVSPMTDDESEVQTVTSPNPVATDDDRNKEDCDNLEKQRVWAALTTEAEILEANGKGDRLKWLLDELQSSEKKHLVPYLENAVEDLLANLQRLQEENEKLEESWKREKLEHERHVKLMADEMDSQVKETEMRLRMKAQADMEDERKSLQTKMDAEMDNLQAHLVLFDKVNSWLQCQPSESYDARLDEIRNKMNDAVSENRQLRMSLLDTQTSIALMRSELLQLRTMYEEKCRELNSEREKVLEVLHEQDHLSRQLSLLHDANRRLQDTNDALRSSYEYTGNASKSNSNCCGLKREKSGSIIGDYIEAKCSYSRNNSKEDFEDLRDSEYVEDFKCLRRARSMDAYFPTYGRTATRVASVNIQNSSNAYAKKIMYSSTKDHTLDQDEGFSSTPESSLLVKEEDYTEHQRNTSVSFSSSPPMKPVCTSTPHKISRCESISEDAILESDSVVDEYDDGYTAEGKSIISREDSLLQDDEDHHHNEDELPKKKISDIIKQLGLQEELIRNYSTKKKSLEKCNSENMTCPRKNSGLKTPLNQFDCWNPQQKTFGINNSSHCRTNFQSSEIDTNHQLNGNCGGDDSLMTSLDEEAIFAPDGPPDKMFNVIFIGDAGVGKSSFALRISKGVFMRHMSATLGVDFLMRTIKVDDSNVELRLWDTAGQERFRSVTTSYFRKADGVMLLYDCTCEQSFLNVRQWVKDIDVTRFYRMMASGASSAEKTVVTSQNIPLMIVGNKVDLRSVLQKSGRTCISAQQGEKLAKDCGASFVEASAKDGTNVMPALVSLVRCMLEIQGLQSSQSTMQLSEHRQKKGCCSK